jgi:hypothetical protein
MFWNTAALYARKDIPEPIGSSQSETRTITAALATAYGESCGKSCSQLKGVFTLAVFCTAGVIVAMADKPYSFYMLLRVLV